ncbi:unnamed protein product [Lupinus luteus]|uniref:RING-type E3 ubiquitin transferase n=1 Tax=Lupinus luteus TaxID=3873 RepID=A0AAV1WN34_LUPLU
MVPESSSTKQSLKLFPLGDHHTGYYTGGDSIIDVAASWNQFSFELKPRTILATQVSNLFEVKAIVSFRSTTNTYNISYSGGIRIRRGYLSFKLEGFWSESSGEICMVGTSSGYSRRGNSLNVDAVFKLSNVFNASNITSLVRGSLESLSSKEEDNYFEPFSLLMFPEENYKYTLDSIEAGEGWWDEKKNTLCVVACNIIGMESATDGAHVSDCSIRLRLRFPSIWSIKNSSTIEGQIWSNKAANDEGYFKRITFRSEESRPVQREVHGLKYEYSQLDRVNQSCKIPMDVKDKEKRYPDAYSHDMRFDNSVRESNRRVAWGYAVPLTVDDQFYESEMHTVTDPVSSFSKEVFNNDSLFKISYKISLWLIPNPTPSDRNSLFNLSSEKVAISAEGTYDAGAGNLCMVGCRDISANNADCEILVKFQFPSVDTIGRSRIKGSIESTRKKSDPLYFKSLDLSASSYYIERSRRNAWRMDMEFIMALISTTLACIFSGFQLYHVKKHPNALPFISLIMMSILTLGYMIPLVLNFEALLTQNPNTKNFLLGNVGMWLEVNEISIRLITMIAFLLQSRLLYLTWSSRKSNESKKSLLVVERKAAYVTLPLYAAGLLIALLLNLKRDKDTVTFRRGYQQNSSSWDKLNSYGGLVLDGFLLPQIILNLFSNMEENVLSFSFYFGATFVRLLPHAYDLYRTHNYASQDDTGSYFYADPSADFYSTAWDIVIPIGGILFAIVVYLQQHFGAHYILPRRFKGSNVFEKVPDSEAEVETSNL